MSDITEIKDSPWKVDRGNVVIPDDEREEMASSGGRGFGKALAVGILLAIFAAGGAIAWYITRPENAPRVSMQMSGGQGLYSGMPATVSISVTNASAQSLKDATLSFYLPEDMNFSGVDEGQRFVQKSLGDISPGAVTSADFSFIPMTPQQSVRTVRAELQYAAGQNGTSRFTNKQDFEVHISRAGVDLQLSVPNQIYSDQPFVMTVKYRNLTSLVLDNIQIRAVYPPSFKFESSTPSTTESGSIWKLGQLDKDASGQITIRGKIIAGQNSAHQFSFFAESGGSNFAKQLAKQDATLSIALLPVSLVLSVNDYSDNNAVVPPGGRLRYAIRYKNNSRLTIRDAQVRLSLTGNMADISGLQGATYFDAVKGQQVWTAATNPQLQEIPPGGEGVVMGDVDVLREFPPGVSNETVTAEAVLTSASLPQDTVGLFTESRGSVSAKISGLAAFAARAYWRDSAARIVNSGPYPPKVGTPTQFTIHWRIEASGEGLKDVRFESYVLSGAKYTGKIKLTGTSVAPQFNPDSGLLVWDLPQVNPAGIGKIAAEAVFQLEITPTVNQVGDFVDLLDTTNVRAMGAFSGRSFSDRLSKLDSGIRDDTSITTNNRAVRP